MLKKYLMSRQEILAEIISDNKEKIKHGQIEIFEIEKKIDELESGGDAAEKIFSVKTRGNRDNKSDEILGFELQIDTIAQRIKEYRIICKEAEKELKIVDMCLEDVSRETSDKRSEKQVQTTFAGENIIVMEKDNYDEPDEKRTVEQNAKQFDDMISNQKSDCNDDEKCKNDYSDNEKNKNVSRETSDMKQKEIVRKLEFCKKLIKSDSDRAVIEINNLIRRLKDH